MSEGTTVFGTGDTLQDGEGELFPEASETEAAPEETPAQPEQETTEQPAETAAEPSAEAEPEAEAPSTEPTEQPPEEFYAGTYKTKEAAEAGLLQLRQFATDSSQRAAEAERRERELRDQITPYIPLLQKYAEDAQRGGGELPPVDMEPDEQAALQHFIDQRARGIAQEMVQPLQAQQQQEAEARQQQEFATFRRDNPDATGRDVEIANVFNRYFKNDSGQVVFPATGENLGYAWEVVKEPHLMSVLDELDLVPDRSNLDLARELNDNPALANIVAAIPTVIDTERGLQWAREQAQVPQVVKNATTNATTQQQTQTEDERKAAYVETGQGKSEIDEAPGKKAVDPLEEFVNERIDSAAKNVFGF